MQREGRLGSNRFAVIRPIRFSTRSATRSLTARRGVPIVYPIIVGYSHDDTGSHDTPQVGTPT